MTAALLACGCASNEAQSPTEPTALDLALGAIGGEARLAELGSFSITSSGLRRDIGEGYAVDSEPRDVGTFELTTRYDVAGDRLRLDYQRTILLTGAPPVVKTFSEIVSGNLGYISGEESLFGFPAGDMLSDRLASIRRQQRLLNPHLILRDAAADRSLVSERAPEVLEGREHLVLEIDDAVHPLSLFVDAESGHITRLATLENHHFYRDVVIEVGYADWQLGQGSLAFPRGLTLTVDQQVVHEETRGAVQIDAPLSDETFAFPETAAPTFDEAAAERGHHTHQFHQIFASIGIPLDGLQTTLTAVEIAPGVHHLTGGIHNSLAIEQENGLVLVDAPLYEARSEVILDWAEQTFPDKPISHVISTHFHVDHAGGLRRFVAEGATVIAGDASVDFLSRSFSAPSTVVPDVLSGTGAQATIHPVAANGSWTIEDSMRPVLAYQIENEHAADMLIAYLPVEKIVFVSDIYSPGIGVVDQAGPAALHKAITQTHQLDVALLAGGHGATATLADLEAELLPQ
ncbi:MAG TPA: MBL fold metallo-hydrolase [Candidatus Nanopelagicales bacterium]|nr:MBL fold metallo-hydrolase [Candidatus Nanopelagicales bacterium]